MVEHASRLGKRVMDRCNLTIITLPNYAYLPEFFAWHGCGIELRGRHRLSGGTPAPSGHSLG